MVAAVRRTHSDRRAGDAQSHCRHETANRVGGTEHAETGTLDGSICESAFCASPDWSRRRVRFARRAEEAGTALDATKRPRMAVPPDRGAAPAVASVSDQQSLVPMASAAAVIRGHALRS